MVGKPNFSPESAESVHKMGASSPTPGLPALDQEREASMADEGGASGMAVENDENRMAHAHDDELDEDDDLVLEIDPRALLIGAVALAVVGFLAFRARR